MSETAGGVPQRIGDAERDQAADLLREHLAQGRLDQDEFDDRVGRALTARTRDDLLPLFEDLPGPKPGSARAEYASSAVFEAPPWQRGASTPVPAVPAAPPASSASSASSAWSASSLPAVRSPQSRALVVLASVAWPVTLLVLFATGWHFWWLIFIPIAISSMAGAFMGHRGSPGGLGHHGRQVDDRDRGQLER